MQAARSCSSSFQMLRPHARGTTKFWIGTHTHGVRSRKWMCAGRRPWIFGQTHIWMRPHGHRPQQKAPRAVDCNRKSTRVHAKSKVFEWRHTGPPRSSLIRTTHAWRETKTGIVHVCRPRGPAHPGSRCSQLTHLTLEHMHILVQDTHARIHPLIAQQEIGLCCAHA